ncbi:MAG: PEP-CTERM sorting domain-containing protein [Phenylobacterium sp.]|nr:MAG: PEP-CTERM sorting domain-containing protein [Phenylobacterium sp.]
MTFGVSIVGTGGTMFSISELSFNAVSNDASDALGFGFNAGDYDYSDGNYVGVLYGADGVLGGGDDTFVTSGPNTQLVNAIFGRGSGNSFENDPSDPVSTLAEQEASLEAAASFAGQPTQFTGTYRIGDFNGSGTFDIAVPEPASWALMILGFGGVGAALRRRHRALVTA